MPTELKTARVRYDADKDEFILETLNGTEWEFVHATQCVRSVDRPNAEPAFIHFSFMQEIVKLSSMEYIIHLRP